MAIDNQFGKGIGVAAGFDLGAQKPLDARVAVNTIAERDAHVTENRAYEGMLVFVDETKLTYQLVNGEWKEFGFNQSDFEKSFADAIEETNDRLETLEGLVVGGEGEGLSKVIADVAANKTAIEKLNGADTVEGSVAKAVADEAKLREQADDSLDDRIAAFETNGTNDVAALANRVKANEDKLDGLENATVKAEIKAAQAAAEKHADDAITALVDSAPDAMNTLNELAKAINDNKGVYDAWVIEHNQAMAQQKADLQAEIDADVKVEKERAEEQEAAIRQEMADAIGAYGVEPDENGEGGVEASGLRKEIAEADAAIRQEMAEAVANIHNHNNKAVLDGIDAAKVAAWDGAQAAAEAKAADLDAALKTELQAEIDADVKIVADELAKQKDAAQAGTLAKQIADVNARLDQNGDIETRIAQAEADIDGLQGLVGQPAQAAEGEEEGTPATGLHLALDNAKAELDQAILDEKGRAESAEGDLQDAIDALEEIVGKEAYRDEELGTEVPATGLVKAIADNTAAIAAQAAANTAQDTKIAELESFKNSMGEESLGLANRIDTNKAAIDKLNGADTVDGSVAAAVKAEATRVDQKIADDIAAESALRVAEEQRIEGLVTAEAQRADAEEKRIVGLVEAEQERAEGIESGLAGRLDVIEGEGEGSIKKAVADLKSTHDSEMDAVEGRVANLEAKFTGEESVDAKIAAAKQAAIDEAARLDGVDKEAQGQVDAAQDNRLAALELSVNGREAADGVEAVKSIDQKIADAETAAKDYADDQDEALHATIKAEMAAVIQSLVAEITEDGMLRIALGGNDEVLVIKEQEIPFVTDAEIDAIIAGLDTVEGE